MASFVEGAQNPAAEPLLVLLGCFNKKNDNDASVTTQRSGNLS